MNVKRSERNYLSGIIMEEDAFKDLRNVSKAATLTVNFGMVAKILDQMGESSRFTLAERTKVKEMRLELGSLVSRACRRTEEQSASLFPASKPA